MGLNHSQWSCSRINAYHILFIFIFIWYLIHSANKMVVGPNGKRRAKRYFYILNILFVWEKCLTSEIINFSLTLVLIWGPFYLWFKLPKSFHTKDITWWINLYPPKCLHAWPHWSKILRGLKEAAVMQAQGFSLQKDKSWQSSQFALVWTRWF